METIDALTSALSVFEGGVVVVSHDAKLISELECDLYLCNSQNIVKYLGDFDDYKDKLLSKLDN
jgi:ATP-binding cassette subfamily F protein 1